MTSRTAQVIHSVLVGFATGSLSFLVGALAGPHIPGWRAMVTGIIAAGASRVAGYLLNLLEAPPPAP